MRTSWAVAEAVETAQPGCLRVACRMPDGILAPAIAYTDMVGPISAGDRLLLNTAAVELGLGTGGVHFVIANASAPAPRFEAPGHIIKLRYTPLQAPVLAAEEADSPCHAALEEADTLDGLPVVCCELLSQVPAVLAGLRHGGAPLKVAVVHTDEAALPAAFSQLLSGLRAAGLVTSVITAGQAFGGDLEAVNLYSALLVARIAAGADVAIVTPGPGTVGTGTLFGFGGVAHGEALNAAFALGGRAIACIRASSADPRPRHRGISHHTRTVLARVSLGTFAAAWPEGSGDAWLSDWDSLKRETKGRMQAFRVDGCPLALNAFDTAWQPWKTMGRGRMEDPLFFEVAAAAGILARDILRGKAGEETGQGVTGI